MTGPIAKYEDGKIKRLVGGRYVEDFWGCLGLLDALQGLSLEYRTQQDRESIKALETAFKARRAAEEEA